MDINYDGYYDDIQPIDAGVRGEGMDPELVKRNCPDHPWCRWSYYLGNHLDAVVVI